MAALPPDRSRRSSAGSPLFGSGYGFGGTSAYAKQVAAFAAGVGDPDEALPSAGFVDPPSCGGTPDTPPSVVQKRGLIRPMRWMAFRQDFKGP
jgi:hypothetical protein